MAELALPRPVSQPPKARSTPGSGTSSRPTSGAPIARPPDARHLPRHPRRRRPPRRRHSRRRRAGDRRRASSSQRRPEAIDPAGLSESVRFERELALHNVRRELFNARGPPRLGAPLHGHGRRGRRAVQHLRPRLRPSAGAPRLDDRRAWRRCPPPWSSTRRGPRRRRFGSGRSSRSTPASRCRSSSTRSRPPAPESWTSGPRPAWTGRSRPPRRRRPRTSRRSRRPWAPPWRAGPSGSDAYDQLVGLRAFDGLDASQILEIGHQQLALNKAARVEDARRIDPTVDESVVVDRVKSNHPATFERGAGRLQGRDAPGPGPHHRARHRHVPPASRSRSSPRPNTCARVIPFAAYFEPPKFDKHPSGIYIVTPSVGDDPNAMREHYYASHQQHQRPRGVPGPPPPALRRDAPSVAGPPAHRRPRVRRGLGHVQRADDARAGLRRRARVPAGDAHRRHLASLPDHPGRAHASRRAVGRRGHGLPGRTHRLRARQRPGRGLPLHLHADVPAQLPARARSCCWACAPTSSAGWATASASRASTTRCCATARCRSASTAGCWRPRPRRVAQAATGRCRAADPARHPVAARRAGNPIHRRRRRPLPRGLLAGRRGRRRLPDGPPRRIAERFVALGAQLIHIVDLDGARSGHPVNLEAMGRVASRVAVPLQVAGGMEGAGQHPPRLRRRGHARGRLDVRRRPPRAAPRVPGRGRRLAGRRVGPTPEPHCRVSLAQTRSAEPG